LSVHDEVAKAPVDWYHQPGLNGYYCLLTSKQIFQADEQERCDVAAYHYTLQYRTA
jgi:hypothetical protein